VRRYHAPAVPRLAVLPRGLDVAASMKALFVAGALSLAGLARAPVALACPSCATAIEARESIREDPSFAFYLGAATAPYLVLGAIVFSMDRIGRTRGKGGAS
jgi:hypothetical protein